MFKCEVCGEEFKPKNKYNPSKTCSKECRYSLSAKSNRKTQRGDWAETKCHNPSCKVEFHFRLSRPRKYCSHECYQSHRRATLLRERTCPECGEESTNYSRQEQIYCSASCRAKANGRNRTKNYPKCLVCGESTESYNRTYCDEHRPTPGPKPAPRKEAVCLCCGEGFSRPGSYPGKMKYCSNECSHRQTKSIRDKYIASLPEGAVVFHSGWEIRFWAACLRYDIPIRSYDGPVVETSVGNYRPDFIINNSDVIEVKGRFNNGDKEKIEESGVTVIQESELLRFEEEGVVAIRKEGS